MLCKIVTEETLLFRAKVNSTYFSCINLCWITESKPSILKIIGSSIQLIPLLFLSVGHRLLYFGKLGRIVKKLESPCFVPNLCRPAASVCRF